MKAKVYIRVDASPQMGLGHMVRCMALAQMLKDDFLITFVCLSIPYQIKEDVCSLFNLIELKHEDDFGELIKYDDIVVLDGYHFDSDYQKQLHEKCRALVIIDDLHDKKLFADVIINHVPGVEAKDYDSLAETKYALGVNYALLRPEFLNYAKKERAIKAIDHVFICFGGSDTKDLTRKALAIVTGYKQFKYITVVTGGIYAHEDSLAELSAQRVHHYHNIDAAAMARLMYEAQLAIVPASGVLFECLATKTMVITGKYIDNQAIFLREFSKIKNVFSCEDFSDEKLKASLNLALSTNYEPYSVVDGKSGERLVHIFSELK